MILDISFQIELIRTTASVKST